MNRRQTNNTCSRVFYILKALHSQSDIWPSVAAALKIVCSYPSLYHSLLLTNPLVSSGTKFDADLLRLLVVTLPIISDDVAFKSTCKLIIQFLRTYNQDQKAMLNAFFTYTLIMRFLVDLTRNDNEAVASIVINVLVCLKQIQVCLNQE